jgi:hypothetical protein
MKPYFSQAYTIIEPGETAMITQPRLIEGYNSDKQLVLNLLLENLEHDRIFNTSLSRELINFLRFTGTMALAFPTGLYMRKKVRKNKKLHYILQFRELLPVRNNIEKGSFAYDTLLFRQSPFQLLSNKSHLANLVCLAILFGDEFIDGIAAAYGKQNVQALLNDESVNYHLQCRKNAGRYELYYAFDICDVLPQHVLESINSKYDISYKTFYTHLQFLLQEMNVHLNKAIHSDPEEAAQLICKACNMCFDTYRADVTGFNENYTLTDLLQYQKTKDDDIIQVLLTLRAVLLNKKQLQFQKQFSNWSSMVRGMQLYDDMQDVAGDCDFQMNTVCYFARNYFTDEWHWLQQHKGLLQEIKGLELHSTISLFMPASCILTMQYARNIAHTRLNWVQRKIQNYLWRKNWLGFNNPLLNGREYCISAVMNKKDNSIPFKLYFIKKQVMQIDNTLVTDDMKWAHITDIILMDAELKKFLYRNMSRKARYYLTSCYMEFPVQRKAILAKALFTAV